MKQQTGPHQTALLWTGPCGAKPRPASPNCHGRSVLFWDITQCRVVIPYWCFRKSHWHPSSNVKKSKTENTAQLKLI